MPNAKLAEACLKVKGIIESVENRCMAADGPVTPTRQEITDAELRDIYEAVSAALAKARGES